MKPLRTAIIGCGHFAHYHAERLAVLDDVQLVGFCNHNIEKAVALADELNIYFVFGFLEREDKNLYNTAILIDPDGDIIGRYRKTHFYRKVNDEFYRRSKYEDNRIR